jgi:hypothetical protein
LAADDLVFGKMLKAKNYKVETVDHVGVYWGRPENTNAYIKEAFRYGLGDGEAKVNRQSFLSNTLETCLRYIFFCSVPITLIACFYGPKWFCMSMLFLGLICLFGLRSYFNIVRNWLKWRSGKYNIQILLFCFYLTEKERLSYIRGYIRGYFSKSPEIKKGAARLATFII